MKKNIHPTYYPNAKTTCACGAVFVIGSTQKETAVEICSQCHPFYTGKKKTLDTTGRVDRFNKIAKKSAKLKEEIQKNKAARLKKEKVKNTKKEESKISTVKK